MATVLKTVRARKRPRGFESHALRSTCEDAADQGLFSERSDLHSSRGVRLSPAVYGSLWADRGRLSPGAAGRSAWLDGWPRGVGCRDGEFGGKAPAKPGPRQLVCGRR